MTMHLFGTVLTPQAVAHNNRGESEGTISTLQKVIRNGDLHSTVSSEAIRYALRESWLDDADLKLNRKVSHNASEWTDKDFKKPGDFIDNDVLGYMHAKKETVSRRGILEISRAVSTTPWPGTVSAHFASPGSNPAVAANNPIPYQCEVHDTRYQYTFALTPDALLKDKLTRTKKTLFALQNLRRPAGNHARFLFDFAPEAARPPLDAGPGPAAHVLLRATRGRSAVARQAGRACEGRGHRPEGTRRRHRRGDQRANGTPRAWSAGLRWREEGVR